MATEKVAREIADDTIKAQEKFDTIWSELMLEAPISAFKMAAYFEGFRKFFVLGYISGKTDGIKECRIEIFGH
jgi:hypothetical protein